MNIRVDLVYPISDGSPVTFKSPCDCSEVTGLIVYSPESVGSTNIIATEFIFADAHKNDVSEMAELFTEGVIVKLILDVTHNIAYVQNADTNAYLEGKFEESKKYVNEKLAESKEYVDSQINLVNASGIPKLGAYAYQEVAEEDGQTVFPIALTTFVKETDMVRVYSGITRLSPITDYVVNEDATITLTEGVPKGRTIDIEIIKHIPMGDEGEVNGVILAKGSIPLDRLKEVPTPESIGALKVYNNITELGLTEATATAQQIVELMQDNSILLHPASENASTSNLAMPFNYGLLIVFKRSNNYADFEYNGIGSNTKYFAYYNGASTTIWSGWKELFTTEGGTLKGLLDFNNLSDYFVLRKGRKIDNITHWMTMGVSAGGEVTIEHYTNDEGADGWNGTKVDGRLTIGSAKKDLGNAIRFADGTKSDSKFYKIYGEHNITKSTTGVTANSTALATGCIHLTYE